MSLLFRGDAIAQIDTVLKEHPYFVMGWLFKAGWLTQSMETRIYDTMVSAMEEAGKRLKMPMIARSDIMRRSRPG